MTAKLLLPQDQDIPMATAEDESAAESTAEPMALKSNEQSRDSLDFRFVILTFFEKNTQC
jgi:hypothetical protein